MEPEPQSDLVESTFANIPGRHTHQEKSSAKEERRNIYDELDRYLQEAISDRRRAQPLERWKGNKGMLRRLAPLLRKFLSAPPCAVPERVFSEIENISDS